ncbi:hypothetical protein [Pseudomonas sp. MONT-RG-20F-20-E-7-02]|uniref:hypothetical protein n=1 Tax=Pseudomonas sp. MONT-RG-20F-20-E-7-02 TaxID=2914979 RepID=UPI001F58488B|nr:hypothetical protein [Pseudomonas sp. MONT-RG-20F-20-E-7-02]
MSGEYYVYKLDNKDSSKKLYCTGIPGDENPLGGVGYQSMSDGTIPNAAATAPSERDALKVVAYLEIAFYGPSEKHYIEPVQ